MSKELNRMQKLAGVPAKKETESLNEHQIGGIVGVGAINQIPPREKSDYEMAFEHYMNEEMYKEDDVKENYYEEDDVKESYYEEDATMDKVKQLADELYNQKVLDGWKNVSMEACLKRATDYYRMDKVVKKFAK